MTPAQIEEASALLAQRASLRRALQDEVAPNSRARITIKRVKPLDPSSREATYIDFSEAVTAMAFAAHLRLVRLKLGTVERRLAQLSIKMED